MNRTAKTGRHSKRAVIVIDDEESTGEPPAEKSVKREEEPEPSSEVVELQKKVVTLERNYQRVCREARRAELRAEFAENLLENKRGLIDGEGKMKEELEETKKKLTEVSSKLEKRERSEEKTRAMNIHLSRENESLKTEIARMRREQKNKEIDDGRKTLADENALNEQTLKKESGDDIDIGSIPMANSMDGLSTIPTFTKSTPVKPKEESVEVKEETTDVTHPISKDNAIIGGGHLILAEHQSLNANVNGIDDSMDALSTIPNFTQPPPKKVKEEPVKPKEESIDTTQTNPDDNQNSCQDYLGDDFNGEDMMNSDVAIENGCNVAISDDQIEKEGEEKETFVPNADASKDFSDAVEMEKRRRPSRTAAKPLKYTEQMDDSDEDEEEPSTKKLRSELKQKSDNSDNEGDPRKGEHKSKPTSKDRLVLKMRDTEMECIECEFRTRSVNALTLHLRRTHYTTPALAGIAFLCECGHESFGQTHSLSCTIANFTVIRKRDGPIRRLDDEKTTPQCLLCEFHPTTSRGYADHLRIHHKSTLSASGIYLVCDCGLEVHSERDKIHFKGCDRRHFTLHKLEEKEKEKTTPQCLLCEKYPKTARGYADHLRLHHKSTLNANGIFLTCTCGLEVRSHHDNNHSKECDRRQFSLHKLDEDQ